MDRARERLARRAGGSNSCAAEAGVPTNGKPSGIMKRIVSVWLPTLAIDRLTRTSGKPRPEPQKLGPYVTVAGERGRLVVVAASREADAGGIAPSMPLADARALIPGLGVWQADPVGDAKALARLAGWCARYTPWAAAEETAQAGTGGTGGAGGLWLDITGCAHLFGGEHALVDDLIKRLGRFGFTARAAIGDTPGAAWSWARFRGPGDDPVLPPAGARAALAALPVAALRLGPSTVETLDKLGLRRIGELYDLPRATLAARFGDAVQRRIDQALDLLDEPISPRRPVAPFVARLAFPEPVSQPEDISGALERLLASLCARLETEHLGARRLAFTIHRSDASIATVSVGVSRPVHDPNQLMRLFAPKLERLDPAGPDGHSGVEVAVLAIPATAAFTAEQTRMLQLDAVAARATGPSRARRLDPNVAALTDRLAGRLGSANVLALGLRESHWPERAATAHPVLDGSPAQGSSAYAGLARPLRLLGRPEPIEVTAEAAAARAPAAFRWRKLTHRITHAEGPERIEPEWWRDRQARPRDYYRVEDREGRRFWLFCERAGNAPRWFLHGMFA